MVPGAQRQIFYELNISNSTSRMALACLLCKYPQTQLCTRSEISFKIIWCTQEIEAKSPNIDSVFFFHHNLLLWYEIMNADFFMFSLLFHLMEHDLQILVLLLPCYDVYFWVMLMIFWYADDMLICWWYVDILMISWYPDDILIYFHGDIAPLLWCLPAHFWVMLMIFWYADDMFISWW